jgi:hypothetical protein
MGNILLIEAGTEWMRIGQMRLPGWVNAPSVMILASAQTSLSMFDFRVRKNPMFLLAIALSPKVLALFLCEVLDTLSKKPF